MLDLSFFVDHKRGSGSIAAGFVEEPVLFCGCSFPVAQQRKRDLDVVCKAFVRGEAVHGNAVDLCIGCFEFGDISLIRLKFLRSATRKGEHIKSEHDVLLAAEVA